MNRDRFIDYINRDHEMIDHSRAFRSIFQRTRKYFKFEHLVNCNISDKSNQKCTCIGGLNNHDTAKKHRYRTHRVNRKITKSLRKSEKHTENISDVNNNIFTIHGDPYDLIISENLDIQEKIDRIYKEKHIDTPNSARSYPKRKRKELKTENFKKANRNQNYEERVEVFDRPQFSLLNSQENKRNLSEISYIKNSDLNFSKTMKKELHNKNIDENFYYSEMNYEENFSYEINKSSNFNEINNWSCYYSKINPTVDFSVLNRREAIEQNFNYSYLRIPLNPFDSFNPLENSSKIIFIAICNKFIGKNFTMDFMQYLKFLTIFPIKTLTLGYFFLNKLSPSLESKQIENIFDLLRLYSASCTVAWKMQEDCELKQDVIFNDIFTRNDLLQYEILILKALSFDLKIQEMEIRETIKDINGVYLMDCFERGINK